MSSILQNKQGIKMLIAGSIMQTFLGILYVWSVFKTPTSGIGVEEVYNWSSEGVILVPSFMLFSFVVGILIGGKLHLKIGSHKTVLLGGLMLATGMLLTAMLPAEAPWLMYITYGIIGGLGVGSGNNAVICAAQKWFPQNRGFATGVVVCAFGFSTVFFSVLVEILIQHFGLRNTFFILSGILTVVTLTLFNFIRLPDGSVQAAVPSAALLAKRQYKLSETIKTKEFYIITLSLFVGTSAFFYLNPLFKLYADNRDVPTFILTIIVTLTGIANVLGRLVIPVISDKIGREKAALIIILTTSISVLVLLFAQGFLFVVSVLLIAFSFGGLPGLYAVIASDYFGIKNAGANYGAVMMGFAFSALTVPGLIRMIPSDSLKYITLSIMAAVGVVLIILLLIIKKKKEVSNA